MGTRPRSRPLTSNVAEGPRRAAESLAREALVALDARRNFDGIDDHVDDERAERGEPGLERFGDIGFAIDADAVAAHRARHGDEVGAREVRFERLPADRLHPLLDHAVARV